MAAAAGLILLLSLCAHADPDDAARAHERDRAQIKHDLEGGTWNERVHAVHRLDDFGEDGLELLERAADDADWQIRMTAVHYLGRVGEPAVGALGRVLDREPCRHVRLTALHWLGRIGPPADETIRRALEDDSRLARMAGRYWLRKNAGQGGVPEAEGDSEQRAERALAGSEDAQLCLSSFHAGRQTLLREKSVVKAAKPPEPTVVAETSVVEQAPVTPATHLPMPADAVGLPPSQRPTKDERLVELDAMLFEGTPDARPVPAPKLGEGHGPAEDLASVPRSRRKAKRTRAATEIKEPAGRGEAGADLLGRSTAAAESFPPGPGLPGREPGEPPEAALVSDAGAPKRELDPVPPLLALLKSREPAKRARAADELGKLGTRAERAAPALRAALKDKRARVRASAALALGSLGPAARPALRDLERALRDRDADVRESASASLAKLADTRSFIQNPR